MRSSLKVGIRAAGLLLLLLGFGEATFATSVVKPSDAEMIIGARAIVIGKVLSLESAVSEDSRIYTYVTVKVQEVLKGRITTRRIILKEMGGQVRDQGFTVFGNPQFLIDERVLLYLDTWRDGSLRTYQMFLGKFSIIRDEATGEETVRRGGPDEEVDVLPHHAHDRRADQQATDQMELNSYLGLVRNKLAANWQQSEEFEAAHFHDVPLRARPAEYRRVAFGGGFEVQWTFIHTAKPRWFEPDSGQPVSFVINPDGAPNPQIGDDITASMNAWSTIPGCSLRIVTGGNTTDCREGVGLNLILFNACDGRWSPTPGCSGVLALGGLGWTGATRVVNGTTFRQATAGFVSFNPFAACSFGEHCNVREIATHELGHAMGLGHSALSDATMFGFAHFDGRCASLRQDDKDGAIFMYPGASGPAPGGSDTIGLYNPATSTFFLRNTNSSAAADLVFGYGPSGAGWVALAGDWNGDGTDTVGLYNPATSFFFLRNANSTAPADLTFSYGPAGAGWIPLAGDWNGDGTDTIGLYSPATGTFFLRNSNSTGPADLTFAYGPAGAGWVPLVGDWNGDSTDTIGLYSPSTSTLFLRNANSTAPADLTFVYGPAGAGWTPIVGDWNADGTDTIGLYNPATSTFFLRNANSSAAADMTFVYGPAGAGWKPLVGDWNNQ